MRVRNIKTARPGRWGFFALAISLAASATSGRSQQPAPAPQQPLPAPPSASANPSPAPGDQAADQARKSSGKTVTRITPEQAKQLFALVDELIKFSSDETGLPIKSTVKRTLTTRTAVESYLDEKFNEDEGAKRLERDEVVLKKFGLLDRDFELKPFLMALLKEQIEAYYDSKTKTVNILDWIDPDEQKSVMAHELTHALQDQYANLEKWDDQTPDDVSHDAAGDQNNLARDEMDTARDAVAEGQATAVMMDYILKPMGKSLVKDPEVLDVVRAQMNSTEDSPVMARAPLLLSESMLFPYREGLSFEQDIWMDQGQTAAFSGALDRPPTSSWEIINPRVYEQKKIPAIPLLPNIHPLVDPLYVPYDIGQIGELDVHIITELFGGDNASRDLTPAWDGGLYWAGQLRSATTPEEQASTKSLGLFYLSVWKSVDSAQVFTKLYAKNLGRKYSSLQLQTSADHSASSEDGSLSDGSLEQVYSTDEGPVVITTRGKLVFVAESFPLPLARKLTSLILDAQGGGAMRMTSIPREGSGPQASPILQAGFDPALASFDPVPGSFTPTQLLEQSAAPSGAHNSLSGDLVQFFGDCGVMKAAVDAELYATR